MKPIISPISAEDASIRVIASAAPVISAAPRSGSSRRRPRAAGCGGH
jgi:hypothetical protein